MLLPLLLLFAAPATSPAAATAVRGDDPPVKVWLDQDNYRRGDKAHVNVELGEDGYLVVLRADADRRVRVLFSIDAREGSGLVLAARSVTPFKFDEFARGDHWDYRVLPAGDDKEQTLLDIGQRMVRDGHFDY